MRKLPKNRWVRRRYKRNGKRKPYAVYKDGATGKVRVRKIGKPKPTAAVYRSIAREETQNCQIIQRQNEAPDEGEQLLAESVRKTPAGPGIVAAEKVSGEKLGEGDTVYKRYKRGDYKGAAKRAATPPPIRMYQDYKKKKEAKQ